MNTKQEITMIANTIEDFEKYVSDQPIFDERMYRDDYIERVARDLYEYCRDEHDFVFGQEIPDVDDKDFWNMFKIYELDDLPNVCHCANCMNCLGMTNRDFY